MSVDRTSRRLTRPLAASFSLLLLFFLAACDTALPSHRFGGYTMGTTYVVTLVGVDAHDAKALERKVADKLVEINQVFSTYIADSELNRLNIQPVGEPFELSAELLQVLEMSEGIYQRSEGAFDPTVMPLVNLWGFGPEERRDQAPSPEAIADALNLIGLDALLIDRADRTATRAREITIDLSAIAKGYGVDLLAALMDAHGLHNYMIDIGGELRVSGHNAKGGDWRIAIEEASGAATAATIIAVTDRGIATSGDYRNYFEQDGKRFSHTIDPRTGYPIDHNVASVTVIAANAALADGWATALSVLGAEKALVLADSVDIAALLLVKTPEGFESRPNEAFAAYMQPMAQGVE